MAYGCSANLCSPANPRFLHRIQRGILLGLVALGGLAATATSQVLPDSAQTDSLPPEVDLTAKFLEVSELALQTVPVMLRIEPAAPQPTYSRMIFTRDSLEWSGSGSLGDLLDQVPGAYVWRSGWLMQPEMVSYRGRGATSVEYILDGEPLIPLGPDSVGVDPSQFVLGMLDRVEIERWPDVLRVHLFTRDHDRLAPASRLAIGTGDQSVARYQATFEKRWESGLGLGLGGDFLNFPTGSFQAGDRLQTQFWGQLNYVPTARIGVQYQVFGTSIDRDPIRAALGDTLSKPLDGSRLDQQVRFFWRKRGDGQGLRTDILLGQSKWSGSGVDQSTVNYGVAVSQRSPRAFWRARLGGSSRWTPVEVRGEAGWAPTQGMSASAEGVFQRHEGNRTSGWLGLRGGIGLPLGMVATASSRFGRQVVAPAILADTAQDIASLDLTLGLERDAFALSGTLSRTSAFSAATFEPYRQVVDSLRPSDATEWASVTGRLRLAPWFTVEGWFSNAIGTPPDGQPASHGWARVAFRSKFLRKFPSTAFDLKFQITMEAWGSGTLGVDSVGAPVSLPPANFLVGFLQLEIGRFRAFFERRNLVGTKNEYVPGFEVPAFTSIFGVRWDFLN